MDSSRFDSFAKSLGAMQTRRRALATALGLLAGASVVATDAAAARTTCRPFAAGCVRHGQCCSAYCVPGSRVLRNRRSYCGCPAGETWCGEGIGCTDTAADVAHCGACGEACASDEACQDGVCGEVCIPVWGDCSNGGTCCPGGTCFDGLCGAN